MKKLLRYLFPLLITCSILSSCTDPVTPTAITLNHSKFDVETGKETILKVTMHPVGTTTKLTWSSDNEEVATVDENGKVIASDEGKATITAKTTEGITASCEVTARYKNLDVYLTDSTTTLQKAIETSRIKDFTKLTIIGTLKDEDWNTLKTLDHKLRALDMKECSNTEIPELSLQNKNYSVVVLPSSLEKLGGSCFSNSTIKKLDLDYNGKDQLSIKGNSFDNARIGHLNFSTDKIHMDSDVFNNAVIDMVTFKEGLKATPKNMFNANETEPATIKHIEFPKSLTTIAENAFNGATLSKDLTLPETIKKIESGAFKRTGLSYYDVKPAEDAEIDIIAFDHKYNVTFGNEQFKIESGKHIPLELKISLTKHNSESDKEPKIIWSSSDDDVATVDATGHVTTKKTGNAIITAKTQDGASARCTVVSYSEDVTLNLNNNRTLECKMGTNKEYIRKLTLSGEMKGDVWSTFKSMKDEIRVLDLRECTNTTIPRFGLQDMNFDKLILPATLEEIAGGYSFRNSTIRELDLDYNGKNQLFINRSSFDNARIGHLNFSTDKIHMDSNVFNKAVIDTVTFKEGLKATPKNMFNANGTEPATIKNIEFPKSLTTIAKNAFNGATLPKDLTLPETIKRIESGAFKGTGLSYYDVKPSEDAEVANDAFDHKYSIDFKITNIKLEAGKTQQLKATITLIDNKAKRTAGEPKVYWSSNAKNVEVDENGNVTAKEAGKATITARTDEGGRAWCYIDVTEPVFKDITEIKRSGRIDKQVAQQMMNDATSYFTDKDTVAYTLTNKILYDNGLLFIRTRNMLNETETTTYKNDKHTLVIQKDAHSDTSTYLLDGNKVEEGDPGVAELEEMRSTTKKRSQDIIEKTSNKDGATLYIIREKQLIDWQIQATIKKKDTTVVFEGERKSGNRTLHIDGKEVTLEEIELNIIKQIFSLIDPKDPEETQMF